jgi:hypothetical protein
MLGEIVVIEGGQKKIINTKSDYNKYLSIIIDGMTTDIRNAYQYIKEHFILPNEKRIEIETDSPDVPTIELETNIEPALLVSENEIKINENLFKKYPNFKDIIFTSTRIINDFDDYDNYFMFLKMPEYVNLLIIAAADDMLTDAIIRAEKKLMEYVIMNMDTEQQNLYREVFQLLEELRIQSKLPRDKQKGVNLNKFPTLSSKGLEGTVYPCW